MFKWPVLLLLIIGNMAHTGCRSSQRASKAVIEAGMKNIELPGDCTLLSNSPQNSLTPYQFTLRLAQAQRTLRLNMYRHLYRAIGDRCSHSHVSKDTAVFRRARRRLAQSISGQLMLKAETKLVPVGDFSSVTTRCIGLTNQGLLRPGSLTDLLSTAPYTVMSMRYGLNCTTLKSSIPSSPNGLKSGRTRDARSGVTDETSS